MAIIDILTPDWLKSVPISHQFANEAGGAKNHMFAGHRLSHL